MSSEVKEYLAVMRKATPAPLARAASASKLIASGKKIGSAKTPDADSPPRTLSGIGENDCPLALFYY